MWRWRNLPGRAQIRKSKKEKPNAAPGVDIKNKDEAKTAGEQEEKIFSVG